MNGLLAFLRLMGVEGGEPIPASANLSELLLRASSALVQRCAPGDHRVSDTAALTDAERLGLVQTRLQTLAARFYAVGQQQRQQQEEAPDDLARLLLVLAVRSTAKEKAVAHIMSLPADQQQELMHDIRETDKKIESNAVSPATAAATAVAVAEGDAEAAQAQVERLRRQLRVAEDEARECSRIAQETRAQADAERATRSAKLARLKSELEQCKDELDIALDQAKQIPVLQNTIRRFEARMDDVARIEHELSEANAVTDSLRAKLAERGSDTERMQFLQDRIDKQKEALNALDVQLHGSRTERDSLAAELCRLSQELAANKSANRQLQKRLDALANEPLPTVMEPAPIQPAIGAELKHFSRHHAFVQTDLDVEKHLVELEALQDTFSSLQKSFRLKEQQLKVASAHSASLESRVDKLTSALAASEEMARVEEANMRRVSKERDTLDEKLNEVTATMTALSKKVEEQNKRQRATKLPSAMTNRTQPPRQQDNEREAAAAVAVKPSEEHIRDELELMSSALHGMALEFQRRRLKDTAPSIRSSRSSRRIK